MEADRIGRFIMRLMEQFLPSEAIRGALATLKKERGPPPSRGSSIEIFGARTVIAAADRALSSTKIGRGWLKSQTFRPRGQVQRGEFAIAAGVSPANRGVQITVIDICSDGRGDRSVESLDVNLVRSAQGASKLTGRSE